MARKLTGNRKEPTFNLFLSGSIFMNALFAVVGLVLFVWPVFSNKMIGIILGILFIIHGLESLLRFYLRDGAKLYALDSVFAILFFVLALIVIAIPYDSIQFVTNILGLYYILRGVLNISHGVWILIGRDESWLFTFVTGAVIVVLGILTIINPFGSLEVTQVIGLFLMLSAVLCITNDIILKKRLSEVVKIFW